MSKPLFEKPVYIVCKHCGAEIYPQEAPEITDQLIWVDTSWDEAIRQMYCKSKFNQRHDPTELEII